MKTKYICLTVLSLAVWIFLHCLVSVRLKEIDPTTMWLYFGNIFLFLLTKNFSDKIK